MYSFPKETTKHTASANAHTVGKKGVGVAAPMAAAVLQRLINPVPPDLLGNAEITSLAGQILYYNLLSKEKRSDRLGVLSRILREFSRLMSVNLEENERAVLTGIFQQAAREEGQTREVMTAIDKIKDRYPSTRRYGAGAGPRLRKTYIKNTQTLINALPDAALGPGEKASFKVKYIDPELTDITKETESLELTKPPVENLKPLGNATHKELIEDVRLGISAYNAMLEKSSRGNAPDSLMQQQEQLNHLETLIHKVLMKEPANKSLRSLMDMIQTAHRRVIEKVVKEGVEIRTYTTEKEDQRNAALYWDKIVSGKGSIKITENDRLPGMVEGTTAAGFRSEVLQSFARLLRTKTGITLVGQLLAGGQFLFVVPLTAGNKDHVADLGGGRIEKTPALAIPGFTEGTKPGFEKARGNANYSSLPTNPAIGPPTPGLPGAGSGSYVLVKPGLQDSAYFADGGLIIPAFIALGHELTHAKHMAAGTTLGIAPSSIWRITWDFEQEETHTIKTDETSENALRKDYSLGVRQSHEGGEWEPEAEEESISIPSFTPSASFDLSHFSLGFGTSAPSHAPRRPLIIEVISSSETTDQKGKEDQNKDIS